MRKSLSETVSHVAEFDIVNSMAEIKLISRDILSACVYVWQQMEEVNE